MKKIILSVLMVFVLSGVMMSFVACGQSNKEEYPRIAYIDNVSYYDTGKICDAVPKLMPQGAIETFVSPEIMPDAFNSANFGSEYGSMEYMFLESGELIIHVGENWYYFSEQ